jgi:M6 family metalloprotease-like protein
MTPPRMLCQPVSSKTTSISHGGASLRSGLMRSFRGVKGALSLAAAIVLGITGPLLAAPYPPEGLIVEWIQPDGTKLVLRVDGDEFYARTRTKDGFTVKFRESDQTYYYAVLGSDGRSLVPSNIAAHRTPPANLAKGLEEAPDVVAAIHQRNVQELAPDRSAIWDARVKAVEMKRAREAGLLNGPAPEDEAILAAPVTGAKVGLMILVQFPDDPATAGADPVNFPTTQAKIERLSNQSGYGDDGNSGSIRDYFSDQSNGLLTHTQLVAPVITLPHPRNYYNYSNYPTNTTLRDSGPTGRLLVADAIAKLQNDGFNFSSLSVDASSNVIATSLLFAGLNSGVWSKGLWPHASGLTTRINVGTSGSPRYISRYQCTNVADSAPVIGTISHELGHLLLGYPDLYDTDDSDGASEGVGEHCLMGSGNYLNSGKTPAPIDLYLKDFTGWANITDVTTTQSLDGTLASVGNRGYRIRKPGTTSEYFLIENRGSGDRWATACRDQGIAIWHIDEAVTTGNQRQQMTPTAHYKVSIEQADGLFDLENDRDRGDDGDFFDSSDGSFNSATTPNSDWWSGTASGISVSVLSVPGPSMSVRFGGGNPTTNLSVTPTTQSVPAAGGTFTFTVNSNTTWSWSDNASWVTSSETTTQSGNQQFTYTVAANTGAASRTAVVTLTATGLSATHTITQAGTAGDDHGNTTATATVVSQNSTTNGNIESGGDVDYFRINVTGSGSLVVNTTGTTDTLGALLNASGTELASDDDGGTSTNFQISYSVTAGTYYVRVSHYDPVGTGAYQLVSTLSGTAALTVTPATQNAAASGGNYSFTVSSNQSWSWSGSVGWVTSSEPSSQNGNQTFDYAVAPNPTTAVRTATITLSGGGITRTHTITQAAGGGDDHGNNIATATAVTQNSVTNGNIETGGDRDYFRINVSTGGSLIVSTNGSTDTYGELFDASGQFLVADDDSGADTNFMITYPVTPGTYYVEVTHYDLVSGTGAYQFASNLSTVAYTISATAAPSAGGIVDGAGTFPAGSSRTVTASANSGYSFSNWTEGGNVVSTAASYTFSLDHNRILVANFGQGSSVPTVQTVSGTTLGGTAAIISGTIANGGGAEVDGRFFYYWSDLQDAVGIDDSQITVSGDDFSAYITGLDPNQTYSFRAYAHNGIATDVGFGAGWGGGTVVVLKTLPALPVQLGNIATRMNVGTGDSAGIGGFIITGTEPKAVVVRGIGASLPVPNALLDPVIELHNFSGEIIAVNDDWEDAATAPNVIATGLAPTAHLESALWKVLAPGAYTVVVSGYNNSTGVGLFEVYDLGRPADSKLANISTRGFVDRGDNVMIGGTIVVGSQSTQVLVRAIGPSLTGFGVPNALQDPVLELHDGNGALIVQNDDWRANQEAQITAAGLAPADSRESAILGTLAPGAYTAIVRGNGNSTGVALVEAYQLQ